MLSIRLAFRRLRHSPGFAAVAILTLALGIGANTTIFTAINTTVLRPLPVDHPEQLVFLNRIDAGQTFPSQSYPDYRDLQDRNSVLSGLMAYAFVPVSLSHQGNNSRVWGYLASGNYFDVLGVSAIRGRTLHAADDDKPGAHPVVVLSFASWKGRFAGDPDIVGKTVKISGLDYTILGVMPAGFHGTELLFAPEFWIPITMLAQIERGGLLEERNNHYLLAAGRLKPGVTISQAEASLSAIGAQLGREHPKDDSGVRFHLSKPGLLGSYLRGPLIGFAAVLAAVAGLVLLIACTNLASLLLARAADRRRETAISLALGASAKQLVGQLMIESLLVSLAGGLAGLLLAVWLTDLFAAWRPPVDFTLNASLPLDGHVFAFTALLSLAACLLFGLAPALQSVRTDLIPALKNEPVTTIRRWHSRDFLVAAQITLSVVLLVGSLLAIRSLREAVNLNLGFNPRNAVTATVDFRSEGYTEQRGREFQRRLTEQLSALPQVEAVALADRLPLGLSRQDAFVYVEGKPVPPAAETQAAIPYEISSGYFRAMQTRIAAGRDFDARDSQKAPRVAIVNRTFAAKFFPGQDAIGKRFRWSKPENDLVQIVGIVENGKYQSLSDDAASAMFFPMEQAYSGHTAIVVRSPEPPKVTLDEIRRVVAQLDPSISLYEVDSLTGHLGLALFPARVAAIALSLFGLLAIILAATGIYGVIAYAVSRRTREIGIRMAIGARPTEVLRSVLGRTGILLGVGTLVGTALAFAVTRFFSPLLYGVRPTDPVSFAGAIGLMALIAFIASLVPAWRAMSIDVMSALREE